MKITSTSKWTVAPTLFPAEANIGPLEQFASTKIPLIPVGSIKSMADFQSAATQTNGSVRRLDLCPSVGTDESGQLSIIPFEEFADVVRAGDIVIFVYPDASRYWQGGSQTEMLKMRGWHAEMVVPKDGKLVLQAPWGQTGWNLTCTPVNNIQGHQFYENFKDIWGLQVHRFLPAPHLSDLDFARLLEGLEGWAKLIPRTTPPASMVFNPMPFSDVPGLLAIGDSLIQKGQPPSLFCVEWVNTVFSLACCYPLTKRFLSSRKLSDAFSINFPTITLLADEIEPLQELPWAAHSEEYIIEAFAKTYLGLELTDSLADEFLKSAGMPRQPVIMPIAPLLETRKKEQCEQS